MPMAFTNDAATIGTTEYSLPNDGTTLTPQTDDCLLQVMIDFATMTVAEQYEWRIKEKVNGSGATQRVIAQGVVTGVQTEPVVTPTLMLGEGWDVTVRKIAGTDRSIGWSLRKVT